MKSISRCTLPEEQILDKCSSVDLQVSCNIRENGAQRSHFERVMGGDSDMVFRAFDSGGQSKMATARR